MAPPAPQTHMDQRTDDIRESIDLARRQIADSLDDIQDSLEQTLDWRAWVQQHPRELIGLGFALGFYLGVR